MISILFSFLLYANEANYLKLNLSTAIQRLLSDNNEIKAHRFKIYSAEAKIKEANSHRYPSFTASFDIAPTPKVTGNYHATEKDWDTWGSSFRLGARLIQPISTFGLIDAYLEAANSNLGMELGKFELKKNELIFLIKKYYYSYQLAYDLVNIAEDGKKKFEEAIKTSDELIEKRKIKREDVYQLQIAYSVFMTKYLEAYRKKDLAYQAIKWLLNVPDNIDLKLEEPSIIPEDFNIDDENKYLLISTTNRPEFKILDSGLNALNSLLKVEERKRYPIFYTSLFANISRANVIEDQNSRFLYDPYNAMGAGIVFGLKFNLDWWKNDPLIYQARAQYDFFNYDKMYKNQALLIELRKVYREALDSKKALDYAMDGERYANRWNFNATLAYTLGNIGAKEMLDAIKAVLEAKLLFNMAIFDYNLAIANLSKVCGEELLKDLNY